MELGAKIYQLRKLAGMTQEQLADKLNISRQTLSKWENGTSIPDIESVVRLSALFQTSLEELLLEEKEHVEKKGMQITLEDMMRINAHNRRRNLLLGSGLLFIAIGIMMTAFEWILKNTIARLEYILYRYMAVGRYEFVPDGDAILMVPALLAGMIGIGLCLYSFVKDKKEKIGNCETS